jgi:hypothetical protein
LQFNGKPLNGKPLFGKTVECVDVAGPVVTLSSAGVGDASVAFGGYGGCLFVVGTYVVESRCADGIVEVHGAAAGDKKDMLRAPIAKAELETRARIRINLFCVL